MTPEDKKSIDREFYDHWIAGSIDFVQLCRADVIDNQLCLDANAGLDKFRRAIEGVMGAVPDSTWTILTLLAEGDLVVCHNTWSGTYGATIFRGVPTPQGKRFTVEHMHIYRIAEDRIAEHWVVR